MKYMDVYTIRLALMEYLFFSFIRLSNNLKIFRRMGVGNLAMTVLGVMCSCSCFKNMYPELFSVIRLSQDAVLI